MSKPQLKTRKDNTQLMIIGGIVTVVALIGMVAFKLLSDSKTLSLSDAANIEHTVNIGVDDWAGYFYLCSNKTRQFAIEDGILIQCEHEENGIDFDERFQKLRDGELQLAAMTADTYVRVSDDHRTQFSSVVGVIDESFGGDAILMRKDLVIDGTTPTESFKQASRLSLGFTDESPSSMIVTSWKSDFGIQLDDQTRYTVVETEGSKDACDKLIRGEIDAAACWEPHVTKALDTGKFVKVIGSDETKNLIVDILVGNNDFINKGDVLERVLKAYGKSMDFYGTNPDELDDDMSDYTNLKGKQLESLMNGIKWTTLVDNGTNWLGITYGGGLKGNIQLFDTFKIVTNLLISNDEISSSPFQNEDPFTAINSTPISRVFAVGESGNIGYPFIVPTKVENMGISRPFKKASAARWMKMKPVGSVDIPKIKFKSGKDEFQPAMEEQEAFTRIVDILLKYPNYRLKIEGHTSCGTVDCKYDDVDAGMDLSKARAVAVHKVLVDQLGVHKNRVMTTGYGSSKPVKRRLVDGKFESKRAWLKRWARVEIILVR